MTLFGRVTVGGVVLREAWAVSQSGAELALTGEESTPPDARAVVEAAHRNVNGMLDRVVSASFSEKGHLSGFFRVTSASSELLDRLGVVRARWSLSLERLGGSADMEFESRVPTIARLSEVAGTASFWHAPPVNTLDYFTGATVAGSTVSRTGNEGAVVARRGIPLDVAPRWTVAAGDYLKGAARVALDGQRHVGADTPPHTTWAVSNSLLEVHSTGTAAIEAAVVAADGSLVSVKGWVPTVGGSAVTGTPAFAVLRNDPEEVVVRLSYPQATGRLTVDLSLRRGSRFVTGVIKRYSATQLGVARTAAEAATAVTGGLRATAADAGGNRYVVGSTRTVVTATATAAISKTPVTVFDFFIGHEVGATPATGDAFADLFAQYLGTASERVKAIRR